MLKTVYQKFCGGCMMVFRREGEVVQFLGSAFLVHEDGYLLTVSHIIPQENTTLMVVPQLPGSEFTPISHETVTSVPVKVVSRNLDRDVALLQMEQQIEMQLPDHFIGTAESTMVGSQVMSLGFSFGHQALHSLIAVSAVTSAKVLSRNESKILLFDNMIHDGDRGGPLVGVEDGLVIGIINGRFDAASASQDYTDGSRTVTAITNMSYAVAIDYGVELMEEEGLKAH
ncbi:MAG: serine protease [Desulfuromonas sp.]